VLKRYVNFMNNPDEKTAVEQFGKGDKYFGIATLMATMPGLPMFGHGQIEGYTEKYGMEYRRAYWDERPDPWLVERHEREITPLLRRRALFAHVDEFLLYDFVADDGSAVEDVFAYSNRRGADRSLVVYHNRYGSASGRIRESVPYAERVSEGGGADPALQLRRRTLAEGLGLTAEDGRFVILRDRRAGLEALRGTRELADGGLHLDLGAYECRVYLDLVEVVDSPGRPYGRLAAELGGRSVPSVEEAMRAILLRPVQEPVARLLEPAAMEAWRSMAGRRARAGEELSLRSDLAGHLADLLEAAAGFVGPDALAGRAPDDVEAELAASIRRLEPADLEDDVDLVALAAHLVTGAIATETRQIREWIDAWGLGAVIAEAFRCAGLDEAASWRAVDAVKALAVVRGPSAAEVPTGARIVDAWRNDDTAARAVGVNEHRGVRWFNREAFEQAVRWWSLATGAAGAPHERVVERAATLREAAAVSGYRIDDLVAVLEGRPLAAAASTTPPSARSAAPPAPASSAAAGPAIPVRPAPVDATREDRTSD
jgi:hypothetical protein